MEESIQSTQQEATMQESIQQCHKTHKKTRTSNELKIKMD